MTGRSAVIRTAAAYNASRCWSLSEQLRAERFERNRQAVLKLLDRIVATCGAMALGCVATQLTNRYSTLRTYFNVPGCAGAFERIGQALVSSSTDHPAEFESRLFHQVMVYFIGHKEADPKYFDPHSPDLHGFAYAPTPWGNLLFHRLSWEYGARPIAVSEPIQYPKHPDWQEWSNLGFERPPEGWREGITRGYQVGDRVQGEYLDKAVNFYKQIEVTIQAITEDSFVLTDDEGRKRDDIQSFWPILPACVKPVEQIDNLEES